MGSLLLAAMLPTGGRAARAFVVFAARVLAEATGRPLAACRALCYSQSCQDVILLSEWDLFFCFT